MSEQINLYKQPEYFDDLIEKVDATKKGGRVAIATMAFDPYDPEVEVLLSKLDAAARRGVAVLLAVDAYAFMFDDSYRPTGPLVPFPFGNRTSTRQLFANKRSVLETLRERGATVKLINAPSGFHLPYAGRSHIKAAVVDSFWRIGGCNLSNTNNLDVMAGSSDRATADFLYDTINRIAQAGSVQGALGKDDIVHRIDSMNTLLIDVGCPGQSIIYQYSLDTIDTASKWLTLTCQFFPSGKTAQHLASAVRRSTDVSVFYNSPSKRRLGGSIMNIYRKKEQFALPPELFSDEVDSTLPFMHAKLVASESAAGVGSHNYIDAGVTLGTAEIAIHSTDKEFAKRVGRTAFQLANKKNNFTF